MSHFPVLVVGKDVEGALAPFETNSLPDCEYVGLAEDAQDTLDTLALPRQHTMCDFWEVGGDWTGFLMLKSGRLATSATAGKIDWAATRRMLELDDAMACQGSQCSGADSVGGLVVNGCWLTMDVGPGTGAAPVRISVFWATAMALPKSARVTIVDCHV